MTAWAGTSSNSEMRSALIEAFCNAAVTLLNFFNGL